MEASQKRPSKVLDMPYRTHAMHSSIASFKYDVFAILAGFTR